MSRSEPASIPRRRIGRHELMWATAFTAIVAALLISVLGDRPVRTTDDRIASIAATVKCPTCQGQSAAESDAPASLAIRSEIGRRLEAGQSAGDIRRYFADRYGAEILLTPPTRGLGGLVWILPLAALTGGAVLVAATLRPRPRLSASDADRRIVSASMARSQNDAGDHSA